MMKLIQVCASQNDLFGLDAEGVVYHYNFNTDTWMRLGRGRRDDGEPQFSESRMEMACSRVPGLRPTG